MSTTATKPKIAAIAPWYGGNRMLAERVGEALEGCEWVGIPFAGGMAEIAFITARTIVANDLHCDIVNLASVIAGRGGYGVDKLQEVLRRRLFHPAELEKAQQRILERHDFVVRTDYWSDADLLRAADWFTVAWMTRSGTAGTNGEKNGKLCLRWEAGGGDSVKRYRSAVESLGSWSEHFNRCTFSTLDCFDFLEKCKDRPRHGIYCDPPFPGPGDKYTHRFTEDDHRKLADRLAELEHTRVVCRFYDHPLIREFYPLERWVWHWLEGRNQANKATPEVLIVNEPA